MSTCTRDLEKLLKYMRVLGRYNLLTMLVEWDQEVNMPSAGLSLRTEVNQMLHELRHKAYTSSYFARLLSPLIDIKTGESDPGLNEQETAMVREIRKDYLRTIKIPATLVKKFSIAIPHSMENWKEAKKTGKFRKFAPDLKKVVSLCRKKADHIGYEDHPYDALLDLFEPGVTVKKLDQIFGDLKKHQKKILNSVRSEFKSPPIDFFEGSFPLSEQRSLSHKVIHQMGLDKKFYHLSESVHPFCLNLGPHDIRLTTHFYPENFVKGFSAVMHECGHGLYEHQLPLKYFGSPLAEAASFGVHESQSRFWECFIGNSRPFWKHYFPILQEYFPDAFKGISLQDFYYAINRVEPSFIRIFADELTYNFHIIVRYEIEKALIEGSLEVKDLPDAFAGKMQDLLGITPKDISMGCLQDVHWSMGAFGYFPSYALGNLYAGSLFVKMIKDHPDWEKRVAEGDLAFLNTFMREKVHQYGRQYQPIELIEKATGKSFSPTDYLSYLEGKF